MALINYATREINAKIVYYGPGLSGKTTNIQYVFSKVKPGNKGKLVSLATQGDRTLFFDFLPVELGNIKGFKTRFHLYTVPGQVFYNSTRKMVLKGSDGVVFVADSQKMMMDENLQSLENLRDNLREMGLDIKKFPVVIQYNKRDLPNAAPVEEINKVLNPGGMPYFEASAIRGDGVLKTLTSMVKYVLSDLKDMPTTSNFSYPDMSRVALAAEKEEEDEREQEQEGVAMFAKPEAEVTPDRLDELPAHSEAAAALVDAYNDSVGGARPAGEGSGADKGASEPEAFTFGKLVDEGVEGADVSSGSIDVLEAEAASDDNTDVEMPEAAPEVFGAFGVADSGEEEIYDAVEVPEELGEMISDTPASDVTDRLPELSRNDYPVETEFSGAEIAAFSAMSSEPETGSDFKIEPASVVGSASPPASPPEPAKKKELEVHASRDVEEKETRGVRAVGEYRLPVRLTTSGGAKQIFLKLNVDVVIDGEGMDDVTDVKLMTPLPVKKDNQTATAGQQKDESKHPPPGPASKPEPKQQARPASPSEPNFKVRKTGVLEKMFGR